MNISLEQKLVITFDSGCEVYSRADGHGYVEGGLKIMCQSHAPKIPGISVIELSKNPKLKTFKQNELVVFNICYGISHNLDQNISGLFGRGWDGQVSYNESLAVENIILWLPEDEKSVVKSKYVLEQYRIMTRKHHKYKLILTSTKTADCHALQEKQD
jgi:hypothetical protein